ncbi:MAG: choice-of-anchor A family protein [Verrucomicrobia bacterium]|nr:choice-of-anchor A family protein [Verrucomicrobiota bacterium]
MSLSSRILAFALTLAAGAAVAARGTTIDLSEAQGYNLLTWSNATLLNSDTEGRVAVGGNATFSGYSVGNQASNPTPATGSLVVGGNLTATGGQVYNGSIYVGGTYSGPGYSLNSAAGSVTSYGLGNAVPFDFAAAKTALTAKSLAYGAEAANGTSVLQWSTLTLTGTQTGLNALNIFNITAAQLASASSLVLNVAAGSHVLINVSGTSVNFSNKGLSGFDPENTLFNFYQANSLTMSGIGIEGSILAVNAAVNFQSGQMNGQLIAKSFGGAAWGVGELHEHPLDSQLPPLVPPTQSISVPDTATTSLLVGLAFALLLAARARRQAA